MDVQSIGQQFVTAYYQVFDTNRSGLACLYHEKSQLLFEGALCHGPQAIASKLTGLPFQVVNHVITTIDSVTTVDGGIMISVLGQLKADNDPPHSFYQTFYLKQIGEKFFILNDIFRLGLHHQ